MKKRKIILIILTIIIFILLLFVNNKDTKVIKSNEVIERINNKDDFILYITSNNEMYLEMQNIVKLYVELFDLDIYSYYKDKNEDDDLKKISKMLGDDNLYNTEQSIILVKKGKSYSSVINIQLENDLKSFLINNNLIDNKYNSIEKELTNDKDLDYIFNLSNRTLIVNYNGESIYKLKGELYKLAEANNFRYYVVYSGLFSSYSAYVELADKTFMSYNESTLLIVKNGKIIDTYIYENEEGLNKFLKKNNFIK